MSTHEVKVYKIPQIQKHPNADKLGIVTINDYTIVVALDSWKEGQLAAYIEPDYVVPLSRPEFNFLIDPKNPKEFYRIKVKKLRGIYSQGLLIPAPENSKEGDDVLNLLEVHKFESEFDSLSTKSTSAPGPKNLPCPKYDLENFKKYNKLFQDGETVILREKIHGCNAKFVFGDSEDGRKMFAGSRNRWNEEDPSNLWWNCLNQFKEIEEFCKNNPNSILFGEIFGQVQDLKYGTKQNEILFVMFDVLKNGIWLNDLELQKISHTFNLKLAPLVYTGPYSKEIVEKHTDGPSLMAGANHIREGIVIRPENERIPTNSKIITCPNCEHEIHMGTFNVLPRLVLKNVSNLYLERI